MSFIQQQINLRITNTYTVRLHTVNKSTIVRSTDNVIAATTGLSEFKCEISIYQSATYRQSQQKNAKNQYQYRIICLVRFHTTTKEYREYRGQLLYDNSWVVGSTAKLQSTIHLYDHRRQFRCKHSAQYILIRFEQITFLDFFWKTKFTTEAEISCLFLSIPLVPASLGRGWCSWHYTFDGVNKFDVHLPACTSAKNRKLQYVKM